MSKNPHLTGQCVECGRIDSTSSWPSSMALTQLGLVCIEHLFPKELVEADADLAAGRARPASEVFDDIAL